MNTSWLKKKRWLKEKAKESTNVKGCVKNSTEIQRYDGWNMEASAGATCKLGLTKCVLLGHLTQLAQNT